MKTPRVKKAKEEVKPTFSFNDKVKALIFFRKLYTTQNRNFAVGELVVLNNYNIFEDSVTAPYRMGIVLAKPSLFSKYPTYQLAVLHDDGVIRNTSLDLEEIICRLGDAPLSFTFA
jgi:hypothetical protein